MPRIPFIGVRISWLIFARNSLLARLAAWAASSARRRSAISSSSLRFAFRKASRCDLAFKARWMTIPKTIALDSPPSNVRSGRTFGLARLLIREACHNPILAVPTIRLVPTGIHTSSLLPGRLISHATAAMPIPRRRKPMAVGRATLVRPPQTRTSNLPNSTPVQQVAPTEATSSPATPRTVDFWIGRFA